MKPMILNGAIVCRLAPGADLLQELTRLAEEHNIAMAELGGIGALSRASLGIFLPGKKKYLTRTLSGELEICSLAGNISLKEGRPFVHAHLTVSDRRGRAFGGHLLPGCRVFVAEIVIRILSGPKLERVPDEKTGGLALWPLPSTRRGGRGHQ